MPERALKNIRWDHVFRALLILGFLDVIPIIAIAVLIPGAHFINTAWYAIPIAVVIAVSYGFSDKVQLLVRLIWLTLALMCPVGIEYLARSAPLTYHAWGDLMMAMTFLSAPAGWFVLVGVVALLQYSYVPGYLLMMIFWVPFLVVGYFQFFVMLPWLIRKTQRRSSALEV
jgi:hypothetical protein